MEEVTDKLTTAQAAALLGCSQRTVQRIVKSLELPAEHPCDRPRTARIDRTTPRAGYGPDLGRNLDCHTTYTGFISKYVLDVRFKLNNSGISHIYGHEDRAARGQA